MSNIGGGGSKRKRFDDSGNDLSPNSSFSTDGPKKKKQRVNLSEAPQDVFIFFFQNSKMIINQLFLQKKKKQKETSVFCV